MPNYVFTKWTQTVRQGRTAYEFNANDYNAGRQSLGRSVFEEIVGSRLTAPNCAIFELTDDNLALMTDPVVKAAAEATRVSRAADVNVIVLQAGRKATSAELQTFGFAVTEADIWAALATQAAQVAAIAAWMTTP